MNFFKTTWQNHDSLSSFLTLNSYKIILIYQHPTSFQKLNDFFFFHFQICDSPMPGWCGVCPSGRTSPSAQPAQLHQGSGGLRVPREHLALLPPDAGVPRAQWHSHESRGQAADQEHNLPRGQGLPHGTRYRQRWDPNQVEKWRQKFDATAGHEAREGEGGEERRHVMPGLPASIHDAWVQ